MKQTKKEQAITLIALVVTLVILIILAAVSINMVLGNQGIFKKAQQSANSMHDAEINTQAGFNSMTEELEKVIGNQEESNIPPETKSEIEQAKESGEVFDTNTSLKDEQGNIVQVPAGFKIASDSGDTVQQGIVIEDVSASGDEEVQGSQFVWIPVGTFKKDNGDMSKEIILGRYTFGDSASNGEPTLIQAAYTESEPENYLKHEENETIGDNFVELSEYQAGVANEQINVGKNATARDLAGFVNSVKNNKGYYIGRYEASFASGDSIENYKAASKISTSFAEDSMNYTEGTLWNYITQLEASKVAINTYSESSSVKSDLINSYVWDTTIVFIQETGIINYANQIRAYNKMSNTGNLAEGVKDEACKIHDMASNLAEWTTEYSKHTVDNYWNYPCTGRGGNYSEDTTYTSFYGNASTVANYARQRF